MANPMFGWSAQDVFSLIKYCKNFLDAYRDGPGGASDTLKAFQFQVASCHDLLTSIHDELQQQDREFFYNKFHRDALKETLKQCATVFLSELAKPYSEQKKFSKAVATAKWLYCDEDKVKKLSNSLRGHISYIQVFLQLLQSKNTQIQLAHLESHGRHLEVQTRYMQRQDQHLQIVGEQIQEIRDVLVNGHTPRWIAPASRTQSVISLPSESAGSALIAPGIYIQGQKSLADVQLLLEQINSELEDSTRHQDDKKVLLGVQAELEGIESRILNSIERNEVAGAQNAIAENILRKHHQTRELRRSRVSRQDSAYDSRAGSTASSLPQRSSYSSCSSRASNGPPVVTHNSQSYRGSEPFYIPNSPSWMPIEVPQSPLTQYTYSSGEASSTASIRRTSQASAVRRPSFSSGASRWSELVSASLHNSEDGCTIFQVKELCQAEILFNNGKDKPIPATCNLCGKYQEDFLCEIYPVYTGKVSTSMEGPSLIFKPNEPRPIPHVAQRGSRAKGHQYPVQIRGSAMISPAMTSLEYIFQTEEESSIFQELLHDKILVLKAPCNVRRIISARGQESDTVTLRLWKTPSMLSIRKDYTMMFYVNAENRVKEHLEISLHDIENLVNSKKQWLKVDFKAGSIPGKTLKSLELQLAKEIKNEDKAVRDNLAMYLNPNWTPTGTVPDQY